MIHASRFPSATDPGGTITERVFRGLEGRDDAPALIEGASGRVLTAGALREAVCRLAGGLTRG